MTSAASRSTSNATSGIGWTAKTLGRMRKCLLVDEIEEPGQVHRYVGDVGDDQHRHREDGNHRQDRLDHPLERGVAAGASGGKDVADRLARGGEGGRRSAA